MGDEQILDMVKHIMEFYEDDRPIQNALQKACDLIAKRVNPSPQHLQDEEQLMSCK